MILRENFFQKVKGLASDTWSSFYDEDRNTIIVFSQVCFLRCAWIVHNKLYTMITLFKIVKNLLVTPDVQFRI